MKYVFKTEDGKYPCALNADRVWFEDKHMYNVHYTIYHFSDKSQMVFGSNGYVSAE